jgi:hypothetical protein
MKRLGYTALTDRASQRVVLKIPGVLGRARAHRQETTEPWRTAAGKKERRRVTVYRYPEIDE